MEIGLFEVYLFLLMELFDENEQSVFVDSAVCNIWTRIKCSVCDKTNLFLKMLQYFNLELRLPCLTSLSARVLFALAR